MLLICSQDISRLLHTCTKILFLNLTFFLFSGYISENWVYLLPPYVNLTRSTIRKQTRIVGFFPITSRSPYSSFCVFTTLIAKCYETHRSILVNGPGRPWASTGRAAHGPQPAGPRFSLLSTGPNGHYFY